MFPLQHSDMTMVKLEQLERVQQKAYLLPINYPYFVPVGELSSHSLYLAVKQQVQQYQKAHGIQIQPKCACQFKTKKKIRKEEKETKKTHSESSNHEVTSQVQKIDNADQKQGRNVNSNLLRMFFRRLEYKIYNEPELMQKILRKLKVEMKVEEFEAWIRQSRIDYRNYIRVPQVKGLFTASGQHQEKAKILRVIFKNFLEEESLNCYLTSRKIKKEAMKLNLQVIRTITKEIFSKTS